MRRKKWLISFLSIGLVTILAGCSAETEKEVEEPAMDRNALEEKETEKKEEEKLAAEKLAEEKEAVEAAAKEQEPLPSAYDSLVADYQEAIQGQLINENDFVLNFANAPFPESYAYAWKDLNNNGQVEFFTKDLEDQNPQKINELWILRDNNPIWIAQSNYRKELFLTADGLLIERDTGAEGEDIERVHLFEIDKTGELLVKKAFLRDEQANLYQWLNYDEYIAQDPMPEFEASSKEELEDFEEELNQDLKINYQAFIKN